MAAELGVSSGGGSSERGLRAGEGRAWRPGGCGCCRACKDAPNQGEATSTETQDTPREAWALLSGVPSSRRQQQEQQELPLVVGPGSMSPAPWWQSQRQAARGAPQEAPHGQLTWAAGAAAGGAAVAAAAGRLLPSSSSSSKWRRRRRRSRLAAAAAVEAAAGVEAVQPDGAAGRVAQT